MFKVTQMLNTSSLAFKRISGMGIEDERYGDTPFSSLDRAGLLSNEKGGDDFALAAHYRKMRRYTVFNITIFLVSMAMVISAATVDFGKLGDSNYYLKNVYTHFWADAQPNAFPDFSLNHKCFDFERLLHWQEENSVDVDAFGAIRRPEGTAPRIMDPEFKKLFSYEGPGKFEGGGVA